MRQYRGKLVDCTEWVYGWLTVRENGEHMISFDVGGMLYSLHVIPETVGQDTGLKCKCKEVFEGDILKGYGYVKYRNGSCHIVNRAGQTVDHLWDLKLSNLEIIGTIHG